ncbi:MAG TPA: hypothetical protein ENJ09_00265 [Planctomycetes bacterium]|nr:hypothetical protein [Planctomycetota bacterium]
MDSSAGSPKLLLKLLSATELRARVLSANIANQNTPGYTRREVRFEDVLRERLQRGSGVEDLDPVVVEDTLTPGREDGNNVNLEYELNSLRENRLIYEIYSSILQSQETFEKIALDAR